MPNFSVADTSAQIFSWFLNYLGTARRQIRTSGGLAVLREGLLFLYEKRLEGEVATSAIPAHVGLILDGNRRHAKAHHITDPAEIYGKGADKLNEVLDWCAGLGIKVVTLWVLSTDNLKRPPEETSGLLAVIEQKLNELAVAPEIHNRKVRVRACGRLNLLPPSLITAIKRAEAATGSYDAMAINIAVAYGGREEITDAVRALLRDKENTHTSLEAIAAALTPADIARHLYAADLPEPDLIIRTSGELRLSGFLLWQSVYSEFYFSDVYWPAFRRVDFLRAIRSFQQRRRRFGR